MSDPCVRTTCPYCGVGCGVLATPRADGGVDIAGDPAHPANAGRLCSKGLALGETLALEGRLLQPEINGAPADWDDALALVARRFCDAIAQHGPESVAFYVSGQLLSEDYYVANKLMKGFIGAANIDTNSRLCMASSVAGHRRAFGADVVPGCYEDLEMAELVVLVGSNLAWCHPVLFQRLLAARVRTGVKIVVVDPRRTATAEAADLHLPIRADGDVALFAGLLGYLARGGFVAPDFLEHVEDEGALRAGAAMSVSAVAARTGLREDDIARFFEMFGAHQRVVTVYSQGVNQSVCGVDKVNAILNCHLATGRIGRPGMGPFSVTGQPNAMGGREVGGLANMLAAHMDIEDPAARARVARFWSAPRMADRPGLKAVDLFAAIGAGRIKALWIMGTNPTVSMPDANGVAAALAACPFVVVADVVRDTHTQKFAHVRLPAAAWGEKDGTVTNSERRISRQRAFLPLPGAARPDWAIVADVARRMGFSGFDYAGPAAIFAEHAALSGYENDGARAFDISAYGAIDAEKYAALAPFQWPQPAGASARESRFFADGRFFTAHGKARMVATPPPLADTSGAAAAFRLNSGRIRDQWHTMTRTGKSPRLMAHSGEPFCEIHPRDAARLGVAPAGLVRVSSPRGRATLRALITERVQPGAIFAPMHWSEPFAGEARINALVDPRTDPVSGQPALKGARVELAPFAVAWFGYAVSLARPMVEGLDYWALAPLAAGFGMECAGARAPQDWQAFAHALLPVAPGAEWIGLYDRAQGVARFAAFAGERLAAAIFVSPRPVEVARGFVGAALCAECAGAARLRILAGRGGAREPDEGATICACNNVGVHRIRRAIGAGARDVEAVAAACGAGAGCGSCRNDIRALLTAPAPRETHAPLRAAVAAYAG